MSLFRQNVFFFHIWALQATLNLLNLSVFAKHAEYKKVTSLLLTEAAIGGVVLNKLFLKISQYLQKNDCVGVFFFNKVAVTPILKNAANGCYAKLCFIFEDVQEKNISGIS